MDNKVLHTAQEFLHDQDDYEAQYVRLLVTEETGQNYYSINIGIELSVEGKTVRMGSHSYSYEQSLKEVKRLRTVGDMFFKAANLLSENLPKVKADDEAREERRRTDAAQTLEEMERLKEAAKARLIDEHEAKAKAVLAEAGVPVDE